MEEMEENVLLEGVKLRHLLETLVKKTNHYQIIYDKMKLQDTISLDILLFYKFYSTKCGISLNDV